MNKFNTHSTKKSLKPLLTISAIATLLIAALSVSSITNANAFNFGLKSEDINDGSIDTDSLFSCVGAAINCLNTNQNNNNEIANNTATVVPPGPTTPGTCDDFVACFADRLDATQLASLIVQLGGLDADATNEEICERLAELTEAQVRAAIDDATVGVPDAFIESIINCLLDAGFVFATD